MHCIMHISRRGLCALLGLSLSTLWAGLQACEVRWCSATLSASWEGETSALSSPLSCACPQHLLECCHTTSPEFFSRHAGLFGTATHIRIYSLPRPTLLCMHTHATVHPWLPLCSAAPAAFAKQCVCATSRFVVAATHSKTTLLVSWLGPVAVAGSLGTPVLTIGAHPCSAGNVLSY